MGELWSELDPQVAALEDVRFHLYFEALHATPETWEPVAGRLDELAALAGGADVTVMGLSREDFSRVVGGPGSRSRHAALVQRVARGS